MKFRKIILAMVAGLAILLMAGAVPAAESTNAVWVHGTIAEPEAPYNLQSTSLKGWGIIFEGKENSFNWFHIPVATPVITENVRVSLWKIFVRFKTIGNAKITNLHAWDGKTKVWGKDGLNLSGDHLSLTEWNINAFVVDDPHVLPNISMSTGLDIVVGVQFGLKDATGKFPAIQFSTAGADFYRSW